MSKSDMLFIRATKSSHSYRRVHRLYKKFYLSSNRTETQNDVFISDILLKIAEKYAPISPSKLVNSLSPSNCWLLGSDQTTPYQTNVVKALISHIALTSVDKIPGYIYPAWSKKTKNPKAA